jgi:hypothetical protein
LYLNIFSPTLRMSSGLCSGADMVKSIFPHIHSSLSALVQFSSRWEATHYLAQQVFSVLVSVNNYHWLLVAPLKLCLAVQDWSSTTQPTDAIIRSHPSLSDAFNNLSLSLADSHKLVFLSPHSCSIRDPSVPLADQGFSSPNLPNFLPTTTFNGFFEPVSMLVVGPPYHENHSSLDRPFQALWIPPTERFIRIKVLSGFDALMAFSQSPNSSLILPFQEPSTASRTTLAQALSRLLPSCWSSHTSQDNLPLGTISHPFSSLGSEGQV